MLPSLLWFLIYSIPPLAGWWLCFRAPFGRRKFYRRLTIAAPVETVWRLLDPAQGGFAFLYETRNVETVSTEPLVLRLERRTRHSHEPFATVEEACELDTAARRILRREADDDGAQSEVALEARGAQTTVSLRYERRTTGLLAKLRFFKERLFISRAQLALIYPVSPTSQWIYLYYHRNWLRFLTRRIPRTLKAAAKGARMTQEVRHLSRLNDWLQQR